MQVTLIAPVYFQQIAFLRRTGSRRLRQRRRIDRRTFEFGDCPVKGDCQPGRVGHCADRFEFPVFEQIIDNAGENQMSLERRYSPAGSFAAGEDSGG